MTMTRRRGGSRNNHPNNGENKNVKKPNVNMHRNEARYEPIDSRRAKRNIYITHGFTKELLPTIVQEQIQDIYGYIDKMTAIQINLQNSQYLSVGHSMAINYGLHDKEDVITTFC